MFGKVRNRVRGKPFKLFSDELPNREYDDTNDGEGDPFKEPEEAHVRGRRKKKRFQSFNDRLSLPSLGTPERDDNASLMSDSRISSSQSADPSVLSPNLEELQTRIRQRHGVKDSAPSIPNRAGLPRRSTTLKYGPGERPTVIKRDQFQGRNNARRKGGVIETHVERASDFPKSSVNAFTEDFGKPESRVKRDDTPVKPKSMLQQLLDASARDFNRRKQINDGLIRDTGDVVYRSHSVRISSGDIRRKQETSTPADSVIATATPKTESKPGILKRETNTDRHSMRIPKVPTFKQRQSPKPRLIHNEPTDSFEDYASRYIESPGGVVSVHVDVPRNKANDLLLLPQKKAKQKRVNFKENDDVLDADSMDREGNHSNDTRSKGLGRRRSRHRKSSPYPSEEIDMKFESTFNVNVDDAIDDNDIFSPNTRVLTRFRSLKPVSHMDRRYGRSSPYPQDDILRNASNGIGTPDGTKQNNNTRAGKNVHSRHEDSPHRDLFSDDVLFVDDQSSIFSTPSPRKELRFSVAEGDITSDNNSWRDSNHPVPSLGATFTDNNFTSESATPARSENTRTSTKIRRAETERIGRPLNIPALVIQNENDAHVHFNEYFTGSHNPEAIGLDELPEGFDLSDLPEDIDRSLSGADLIKAYRLWDRERKAFPSGLRKIDIPFDPRDFILSKLRNANAKSQRSQLHKPEAKVTLV